MIFIHGSDLDNVCILSGENSVRELVSVYNPGVTENLRGITEKEIFSNVFIENCILKFKG